MREDGCRRSVSGNRLNLGRGSPRLVNFGHYRIATNLEQTRVNLMCWEVSIRETESVLRPTQPHVRPRGHPPLQGELQQVAKGRQTRGARQTASSRNAQWLHGRCQEKTFWQVSGAACVFSIAAGEKKAVRNEKSHSAPPKTALNRQKCGNRNCRQVYRYQKIDREIHSERFKGIS